MSPLDPDVSANTAHPPESESTERTEMYDPRPSPCCVHLRCKSMYIRADERPGRLHWSNAMGYWCVQTHDNLGPDGQSAMHPDCQPGRDCHEPGPKV